MYKGGPLSLSRQIILSLSLLVSLSACGDSSSSSAITAQSLSLEGGWDLMSVNDVEVAASDAVSLWVSTLESPNLEGGTCTGVIVASLEGSAFNLVDNGISTNGCYISFAHDSNHSKVVSILEAHPSFQISDSILSLVSPAGVTYKFQRLIR